MQQCRRRGRELRRIQCQAQIRQLDHCRQLLRGRFEDKDAPIAIFNEHIESAQRHVPADKLLVLDVRDGWGPLCEFLGLADMPDEPFPHVIESTVLTRKVRRMRWIWRTLYAFVIAFILCVIGRFAF